MNYSLEFILDLEKKISESSDSLGKYLKLYLLNQKLSILYKELGKDELSEISRDKSYLFLAKTPEGDEKNKAIRIPINNIFFDKF